MRKADTLPGRPERHQDWPTRFFAFIEERRSAAFAWGRNDCCLFACDGILAITGLDPAGKMFRGKYRGALGAARLVARHGGIEAIAETVCARHGFAELRGPAYAQRGDVVLRDVEDEMKAALGLCIGGEAVFVGAGGLVEVPLTQCRRAWRVTHHGEAG